MSLLNEVKSMVLSDDDKLLVKYDAIYADTHELSGEGWELLKDVLWVNYRDHVVEIIKKLDKEKSKQK